MISKVIHLCNKIFHADRLRRNEGWAYAHSVFSKYATPAGAIDVLWQEPRDWSNPYDRGIIEYTHTRLDAYERQMISRHQEEHECAKSFRRRANCYVRKA